MSSWLLLFTTFSASLAGSLHCVGMCGGFVALVGNRRSNLFAYHGVRALAYLSFGALSGSFAQGINQLGASIGLQNFVGPLMGIVLIGMALFQWVRGGETLRKSGSDSSPVSIRTTPPSFIHRLQQKLARSIKHGGPWASGSAGLMSALLPCGWLWSYVFVAAGTGDSLSGILVMLAFWLGGLPALLFAGLIAGRLSSRFASILPRVTLVLMIGLGLLSLFGKWQPLSTLSQSDTQEQSAPPSCH